LLVALELTGRHALGPCGSALKCTGSIYKHCFLLPACNACTNATLFNLQARSAGQEHTRLLNICGQCRRCLPSARTRRLLCRDTFCKLRFTLHKHTRADAPASHLPYSSYMAPHGRGMPPPGCAHGTTGCLVLTRQRSRGQTLYLPPHIATWAPPFVLAATACNHAGHTTCCPGTSRPPLLAGARAGGRHLLRARGVDGMPPSAAFSTISSVASFAAGDTCGTSAAPRARCGMRTPSPRRFAAALIAASSARVVAGSDFMKHTLGASTQRRSWTCTRAVGWQAGCLFSAELVTATPPHTTPHCPHTHTPHTRTRHLHVQRAGSVPRTVR